MNKRNTLLCPDSGVVFARIMYEKAPGWLCDFDLESLEDPVVIARCEMVDHDGMVTLQTVNAN